MQSGFWLRLLKEDRWGVMDVVGSYYMGSSRHRLAGCVLNSCGSQQHVNGPFGCKNFGKVAEGLL